MINVGNNAKISYILHIIFIINFYGIFNFYATLILIYNRLQN